MDRIRGKARGSRLFNRFSLSLDIAVAGKATTAEEALEMIERQEPDIFLVETGLTGSVSGSSVVRAARQRVSSLRVIALAGSADPADIARMVGSPDS